MQTQTQTWPAGVRWAQSGPRLSDRIRARVLASRLDRELASGVSPAADVALALRADALARPPVASQLGDRVRWILREAHRPSGPGVRIRGCRERVLAAEDDLRLLASRVHSAQPLTVTGIAKLRVLLTDGTGPLYYRGSPENLGAVVREIIAALS